MPATASEALPADGSLASIALRTAKQSGSLAKVEGVDLGLIGAIFVLSSMYMRITNLLNIPGAPMQLSVIANTFTGVGIIANAISLTDKLAQVISDINERINDKDADFDDLLDSFFSLETGARIFDILESFASSAAAVSMLTFPPAVPFLFIASGAAGLTRGFLELPKNILVFKKDNDRLVHAINDTQQHIKECTSPDQQSVLVGLQATLEVQKKQLHNCRARFACKIARLAFGIMSIVGVALTLCPYTSVVGFALIGAAFAGFIVTGIIEKKYVRSPQELQEERDRLIKEQESIDLKLKSSTDGAKKLRAQSRSLLKEIHSLNQEIAKQEGAQLPVSQHSEEQQAGA